MMTDNELDNLFKNALGSHEAPVPPDMWQRIQPAGDKKRRIVFWWKWYTAAAIFLMAGMATWWYTGHTPATNSKNSYNTKAAKEPKAPETAGTVTDSKEKTLQKGIAALSHKKPDQYTAAIDKQNRASDYSPEKKYGNSEALPNNPDKPVDDKRTTLINNEIIAAGEQQVLNNATGEKIDSSKGVNTIAAQKNNTPLINTDNKTVEKKGKKKIMKPWTIEFAGTTAYADKETYAIRKENSIGIAAAAPQLTPKPSLWSFGASVRAGVPLTKKLTLKTGLQFTHTREKVAYQQETVNSFIAVNGFADTSVYRQIIYQPQAQQSTYRSISIPLLLSYQTGKKIKAGITAGVVVNARSWYKGKMPDANATATLKVKNTYKRVTGSALYLSISAAKKVGLIEIFAEPQMQYSLNSFTKKSIPFKQKINTYGLSIGVRTALHK